MKKAVFFDRDGTLMIDRGYMSRPEQVELMPGTSEVLKSLRSIGFQIVIISNQSGIGRGLMTAPEADAVMAEFLRHVAETGACVDAVYYCPHAPADDCDCRKPKPGLFLQAARDHGIELKESFVVGDKPSDCEAGQSVGCRPIYLINNQIREPIPAGWVIASNLKQVLKAILSSPDSETPERPKP